MATLVKALKNGFANGGRVRAGQEFVLPDGVKPGHWLQVLQEDVGGKSKAETEADAAVAAKAKKEADAKTVKDANDTNRNIAPSGQAEAAAPVKRT